MSLGSGRCHYHPDRAGLGICVECRNVICAECTTPFDGINRCATCLGQRLAKTRQQLVRNDWSVGGVVLAVACLVLVFSGVFGLASLLSN